MMCEYCEGRKKFEAVYKGEGIMTMRNAVSALIGSRGKGDFEVARIDHGLMLVDNSSGEYAELGFKINYCPNCGRKMSVVISAVDSDWARCNCGTNVIFRNQGRRKGWLQAWREGEVMGK